MPNITTTFIIFQTGEDGIKLYAVAGDRTHLNDIFLNSVRDKQEYQDEICELFYGPETDTLVKEHSLSDWVKLVRMTPWPVITCGELP